jgi:hypothetical protein
LEDGAWLGIDLHNQELAQGNSVCLITTPPSVGRGQRNLSPRAPQCASLFQQVLEHEDIPVMPGELT